MVKILAAGDLHGDLNVAKNLSKKAQKEKVNLIVLTGDIHGAMKGDEKILKPFKDAKQKVLFVPGNWDSSDEVWLLEKHARNIHNYYVTYDDVGIIGIGSPDWQLSLEYEDVKGIHNIFKKIKAKKRVLVSHLHAEGTLAEFTGIKGESTLRTIIEKWKPDIFVASHIHSAEGIEEKIGGTHLFQVGPKGKIFEI